MKSKAFNRLEKIANRFISDDALLIEILPIGFERENCGLIELKLSNGNQIKTYIPESNDNETLPN